MAAMEAEPDEQISDSFVCCVCLDLLYKPIVLACGHVSCFWCVHKSMNGLRESHCPICRHPYHYFPNICQMLHFLLLKIYPTTYKRRETQTLEYERAKDCFSPELNDLVCPSHNNDKLNHLGDTGQSSPTNSKAHLSSYPCSFRDGEGCANMEQVEVSPSFQGIGGNHPNENSPGGFKVNSDLTVEENNLCEGNSIETHVQVSVADMLCVACKELLIRPVVLNCGHIYCETCICIPANESLRCQVCQSLHPSGLPKVCLELHHFLEGQFPTEYAQRRVKTQIKEVDFQQEPSTTRSAEAGKEGVHFSFPSEENFWPSWGDHNLNIHFEVGCDFCGMYPIAGSRYKCKDCVEVIGFDLCGECYNTRSKLPGRFNQQHTPEHRFEIVRSNSMRSMILRLIRGQVEDGSAAPNLPNNDIENPENVVPPVDGAQQSAENGLVAPDTQTSLVEDQSDEQLPAI